MRSFISLTVVLSLAAPVAAAQVSAGPIARSLTAEATKLAAAQAGADAAADAEWKRLQEVKSGTDVVVVLNDGRAVRTFFVSADDASLDVGAFTKRIPRSDVLEVREAKGKGSASGAWVGILGGVAASWFLTVSTYETRCYPHCSAVKTGLVFADIGFPVGLGFAGYYGGRHRPEVFYRSNGSAGQPPAEALPKAD